jgi:hypothetical protein
MHQSAIRYRTGSLPGADPSFDLQTPFLLRSTTQEDRDQLVIFRYSPVNV